jgi:hypothetical protein
MNTLTRGAVFGAACALCAIVAAGTAAAESYPPGTNCQNLLPALRAGCQSQVQQNTGAGMNNNSTVVPNSSGGNTVPTPGNLNTGTGAGVSPSGVAPTGVGANGVVVAPNGVTAPSSTSPTNRVNPNGTMNPNVVSPNGTVNTLEPNTVNPAPAGNTIIPPINSGTGAGGTPAGTGTGTGAGGAGTGTTGN